MNTAVFESVGCDKCTSFSTCGGAPQQGIWGCYDHCLSKCDPDTCDFTCPHNPRYAERWWEVGGMGPVQMPTRLLYPSQWPEYIPRIFGRSRRARVAATATAAVPLAALFRQRRRGELEPVATNPDALRERFQLRRDARVIATGVDQDDDIERLWHYHDEFPLGRWLLEMGIEVATAPNYSYFAYAPRDHFLWNRKRMLQFVARLALDQFPVVPHIYGDTRFDYRWSASFYREHPHLTSFAVELQTSDAEVDRLPIMVDHLKHFRDQVGRELTAFVIGGRHAIRLLAPAFDSLVVIEASAYMKTIRRRFAFNNGRKLRWKKIESRGNLDALLDHNIAAIGDSICGDINAARGRVVLRAASAA